MSIDDGTASEEACSRACMAVPWLIALGWTILFSALFAKLRRINIVVANAAQFKSVRVTERDVMAPFAWLFTLNVILLTVWT
jgi:gamma-aminobutyric acid type B receptor